MGDKYAWNNRPMVWHKPIPINAANCPIPRFELEYSLFPFEDDEEVSYNNTPTVDYFADPVEKYKQTCKREMHNHENTYRFNKKHLEYMTKRMSKHEEAKRSDPTKYHPEDHARDMKFYQEAVLEESKHWAERTIPKREALCLAMHPRLGEKSLLSCLEPELFQSIVMAAL